MRMAIIALSVALTGCIDEQYQRNQGKDTGVQEVPAQAKDENVQSLNEKLEEGGRGESAPEEAKQEVPVDSTNPELTIEQVLFEAVQKGNLDKVRTVFEEKFVEDPNLANEDDRENQKTLLMEAASWGRIAVVEYLLGLGADPALQDRNGKTAVDWAGSNLIIKVLLSGQQLSMELMQATLMALCKESGHIDEILFILGRGVSPDFMVKEPTTSSPIFESARNGLYLNVETLLNNGADVNFHENGHTALIGAITSEKAELVKLVVDAGADQTIKYRRKLPREYAVLILENKPEVLEPILALLD